MSDINLSFKNTTIRRDDDRTTLAMYPKTREVHAYLHGDADVPEGSALLVVIPAWMNRERIEDAFQNERVLKKINEFLNFYRYDEEKQQYVSRFFESNPPHLAARFQQWHWDAARSGLINALIDEYYDPAWD